MYNPDQPFRDLPGMVQAMNLPTHMMTALQGTLDAHQAWRQARPERVDGMGHRDYRQAVHDWRKDRPGFDLSGGMRALSGQGNPVQQQAQQGFAPQAAPHPQPGMVGNSLKVQGMYGGGGFDLPRY